MLKFMKKKFLILVVFLALSVLLLKFVPESSPLQVGDELDIGNTTINIESADTPEEQIRGLSGRDGLKEDEGMLFVFDTPSKPGFWMKDMSFAIDIIWIDENGKIVGIERAISPSTYPETFYPSRDIKYVLEVKEGFSDRAKVNVGDVLYIGQ